MAAHNDIWKCPVCGTDVDIGNVGFYTEVACPQCGAKECVHTQLANFKLLGVLGIGGMSVVYKAKDLILNRPIAIKLLNDTYRDSPERIARFENECAMMARVRHENVVSVYSAGWSRGQFYIAMELIQGRDLEQEVRRKSALAPARALEITREVVLGLEAANKAGLLHRDMKPGNILIAQKDNTAKVLDFGLSLGNQAEDTEEVIWATPFYVAPETLIREKEDVRTDIYALGMTLRFFLTGADDIARENLTPEELLEYKRKLPAFSTVRPDLPPAYCDLVDHMTAFKSEDRPTDYKELLLELDEVQAVQREYDDAKSPRKVRLRRFWWMLASLFILSLGAAGATCLTLSTIPPATQLAMEVENLEDWGDLTLMRKAAKRLSAADWAEAKPQLEHLVSSAKEPTLAAFCGLLRYYLALTENNKADEENYRRIFHQIVTMRGGQRSAAGSEVFKQLQAVDAALNANPRQKTADGVKDPLFRAILLAAAVESESQKGEAAAKALVEEARGVFATAPTQFHKLSLRLFSLGDQVQQFQTGALFKNMQKALREHDFQRCDECMRQLEEKKNTYMSPLDRERLDVMREIRNIGEQMVDVLRTRAPKEYRKGMSPATMRYAANKIDSERFGNEVYFICLMMQGDYRSAFDLYPNIPYGTDDPFLILVKAWKKALDSYARRTFE